MRFYKSLYSEVHGGWVIQTDSFLSFLDLPVLNEKQNKRLIADITEKQLEVEIKRLKLSKSPGPGDYTAEW